jgi:hypothetical protein
MVIKSLTSSDEGLHFVADAIDARLADASLRDQCVPRAPVM